MVFATSEARASPVPGGAASSELIIIHVYSRRRVGENIRNEPSTMCVMYTWSLGSFQTTEISRAHATRTRAHMRAHTDPP